MAKLTKSYDETLKSGIVTFDIEGVGVVAVDADAMSESNRRQAMLHGICQKVGDAAALPKGSTDREKFEAIKEVAERIQSGSWNATRESGEVTPIVTIEALAKIGAAKAAGIALVDADKRPAVDTIMAVEVPAEMLERVRDAWKNASDDQKKAWRASVITKAVVDRIRSERSAATAAAETAFDF